MKKLRIGFIGLGLMGNPMAKNVLKKGFPLWVWNRTVSKSDELEKLGAKIASSPAELASKVDLVITMVTGPKDVEGVLLGKNGVVSGAQPGLIVVDMSTIGPKAAKQISKTLDKHQIEFLDAPVTGSTPKAITGELTIFVGGKPGVLIKALPVLKTMGTTVHHLGPVGMGQAIKLVNNLLVAETLTTLAEGFLLGDKLGLSRDKVAQTLKDVPAVSPFMKMRMDNLVNNRHETLFSIANLDKDLKLALSELNASSKSLLLLKLTEKYFHKGATSKKLRDLDISAIIQVLK